MRPLLTPAHVHAQIDSVNWGRINDIVIYAAGGNGSFDK